MPMADYKVRIIANACITRYDNGESNILTAVVDSYNLASDDRTLVLTCIYAKRPDVEPAPQV